jgi:hypothetical protein
MIMLTWSYPSDRPNILNFDGALSKAAVYQNMKTLQLVRFYFALIRY